MIIPFCCLLSLLSLLSLLTLLTLLTKHNVSLFHCFIKCGSTCHVTVLPCYRVNFFRNIIRASKFSSRGSYQNREKGLSEIKWLLSGWRNAPRSEGIAEGEEHLVALVAHTGGSDGSPDGSHAHDVRLEGIEFTVGNAVLI